MQTLNLHLCAQALEVDPVRHHVLIGCLALMIISILGAAFFDR